jgi:2',3'-cyclic-nucleotide 2'-phosphodiesterase (5'-nucleotidase family)
MLIKKNTKQGEKNMTKKNIEKVSVSMSITFNDTNKIHCVNQVKEWFLNQFKKSGASDYVVINGMRCDLYTKYKSTIDGSIQIADTMQPLKDHDIFIDIEKKGKVKKHWKELTVQEWYDYKRGDSNIEVIEERI